MTSGDDLVKAYLTHREFLFGYTLALTRDPEAAEDVFQEVGLAIVGEARKDTEVEQFMGWARELVRRRVAEYFRLRSRRRSREGSLEKVIERAFSEYEPPAGEGQLRHAALLECLGSLPERRKELIQARYQDLKSIRAIAEAITWTDAAVKVALWKARQALFECVENRVRLLMENE